jgi:hypothetical protein
LPESTPPPRPRTEEGCDGLAHAVVARQPDKLQLIRVGDASRSGWTLSSRSGLGRLSPRRQLVLESDALEFLTEMLDPIFGLLALRCRHESCNNVRAAGPA